MRTYVERCDGRWTINYECNRCERGFWAEERGTGVLANVDIGSEVHGGLVRVTREGVRVGELWCGQTLERGEESLPLFEFDLDKLRSNVGTVEFRDGMLGENRTPPSSVGK